MQRLFPYLVAVLHQYWKVWWDWALCLLICWFGSCGFDAVWVLTRRLTRTSWTWPEESSGHAREVIWGPEGLRSPFLRLSLGLLRPQNAGLLDVDACPHLQISLSLVFGIYGGSGNRTPVDADVRLYAEFFSPMGACPKSFELPLCSWLKTFPIQGNWNEVLGQAIVA